MFVTVLTDGPRADSASLRTPRDPAYRSVWHERSLSLIGWSSLCLSPIGWSGVVLVSDWLEQCCGGLLCIEAGLF